MLLENQASEYLSRTVDPSLRRHVIIANFAPDGRATFLMRAPNGTEDQLPTMSEADGEILASPQLMSQSGE